MYIYKKASIIDIFFRLINMSEMTCQMLQFS